MLNIMLLFPELVRVLRELEPHSWESFRDEPDWMVTLALFISPLWTLGAPPHCHSVTAAWAEGGRLAGAQKALQPGQGH